MDLPGVNRRQTWWRYYDPIDSLSEDLPFPILGIMILIWQFREADLQETFPLDSIESRLNFLLWCMNHGRNEYVALAEAETYWAVLSEKADPVQFTTELEPLCAISKLMLLIRKARQDLPFDLTKYVGRAQFVLWYLTHGREELGLTEESIPNWQISYFNSPSNVAGINCLQKLIYDARPDLQKAFILPAMNDDFLAWYDETFMTSKMKFQLQTVRNRKISGTAPHLTQGVNVIGYAFGQLGIGEDARMATKSLISAGIATALIDFPPGNDIPQNDLSMSHCVANDIKYDINIFNLTALETGRFFAERGTYFFSSTFNIGYWPWELEQWPNEWQHLYSLVDEVWASSMHTYKSVLANSPIPVKLLPMAVALPMASRLTRSDFGLPDDATLFLFSFDLNSSSKRKNPAACVEAFLMAFPLNKYPYSSAVGLVIKIHPPKSFNPDWEKLRVLRDKDSRIHIIESTLNKEDLMSLYKICDCFISLHRAEGFGRNIAESMLLGTPAITTAYSGNMDYTNNLNSYLVDFKLIPLEKDDYPYGRNKFWAEPSIAQAAICMRAVVERSEDFKSVAFHSQRQIKMKYDFSTVGENYALELKNIRQFISNYSEIVS